MVTNELFSTVPGYVASCQNYDGGIAAERGLEAHGGYSYCGLTATAILGHADSLHLDRMLHWMVHRQMALEGGYQGRTNKLVDSCYTFWQGGALRVLHEVMKQHGKPVPKDHYWDDPTPLQLYVLLACQASLTGGGLRDKPGKGPDFYHTCYALSGLSASQWNPDGAEETTSAVGPRSNLLRKIDPFYNVRYGRARDVNTTYTAKEKLFKSPNGEKGTIGKGIEKFLESSK